MATQADYNEILMVLSNLIALLEKTEDYDWAFYFNNIKTNAMGFYNKEQIAREILAVYSGGMGSFLDLILQKDMKPLIEESIQLEEYREKLFQLCRKTLVN